MVLQILLVEDNAAQVYLVRKALERWRTPYNLHIVSTAEEALDLIPKHHPDVVLMDIQLPKMSGVECVGQLKGLLPSVQVIMVTVYQDPDRIFRALRAGASGYLLKRATPDMVLNAIRD